MKSFLPFMLVLVLGLPLAPLRSAEPDLVQKTLKSLEERELTPVVKLLASFLIQASKRDFDKAHEVLPFDAKMREQLESDAGLKHLEASSEGHGPIELAAFKYISSSLFEFFFIIPSANGPTGFRVGVATFQGKGQLAYFKGSASWTEIIEMADSHEVFSATITLNAGP